ncbi:MAG: LamG-like jellyroll fold domain-containing protein, partial [Patescibacteria group bacterium]|nr:LamG-like jellyroll fold domain-containing protein [Patescibacteria group bacterium]
AVAFLLTVVAPAGLRGAIIGHWSFDEGTGQTVADSTGANAGRLGSSTGSDSADPTFVAGKIGDYALSFDGGDYVHCGTNNVLTNLAGQKTFSFWTAYQTTTRSDGFLGVDNSTAQNRWYFDDNFQGDDLRVYRQVGDTASVLLSTNADVLKTDRWQHVVLVDNGVNLIAYVDGAAVTGPTGSSFDFSSFADPVNTAFWIGRGRHAGGTVTLLGHMDDVSVWNNALTATEVLALCELGNDAVLNYSASQVEQLFNLYEAGSGVVALGDWRWRYAEDIGTPPGVLSFSDSQYAIALAANGSGLIGVPEPSAMFLLVAGVLVLLARRSRPSGAAR